MQRKEKSISRVTLWQISSRFLLQGISFFSAPIFTRLLSPNDFGLASVYMTWVSFFALVVGLQTHGSIPVARMKIPEQEFNRYLSSILTISIFSLLLSFVIIFIFNSLFVSLTGFDSLLIYMMLIQSFFSGCVAFFSTELIQRRRVELNTLISLIITILTIGLSIYCISFFPEKKYFGKIFGSFVTYFLIGLILVVFILMRGRCFFNRYYWSFCLKLSLPLIFHGAGGLILSQSDRIMLKNLFNDTEVGIYSVVYSLASVLDAIWMSFNTSWVPFYYDYKKNNDSKEIHVRSIGYMWTFTILTIGFILCSPEVFKMMAPNTYWTGLNFIPLIVLGFYFNYLYAFPANYEFYHEQTKLVAIGTVLTAIVNIILNFILIPRYGGVGAAFATLIGFIGLFLFHHLIAKYFIKKDTYEYRFKFYLAGLVPVCLSIGIYYLFMDIWLLRWIIAIILGCILLFRFKKRKSIF